MSNRILDVEYPAAGAVLEPRGGGEGGKVQRYLEYLRSDKVGRR